MWTLHAKSADEARILHRELQSHAGAQNEEGGIHEVIAKRKERIATVERPLEHHDELELHPEEVLPSLIKETERLDANLQERIRKEEGQVEELQIDSLAK